MGLDILPPKEYSQFISSLSQTKNKGEVMSYIKVSNDGVLDVVKACSMLGASVKEKSSAIGMFGTGLKYALAQAARIGAQVWIASGEKTFKIVTKQDVFRDNVFHKVCLKDIDTEEMHETPITTNFGKHDWDDPWFVYRELVCNAKDEPGYRLTLVDNIRKNTKGVSIYLEYEVFGKFFDRSENYFAKDSSEFVRKGTGIVFKKGVRVGELKGLRLDFQHDWLSISESRQMCEYTARYYLAKLMNRCTDVGVWEEFLDSKDCHRYDIDCSDYKESNQAFVKAMTRKFGRFCLSPETENVKSDLKRKGYHPFVKPSNWKLRDQDMKSFKDILVDVDPNFLRQPEYDEVEMLEWGLRCCKKVGISTNVPVKVYDSKDSGAAMGCADMRGQEIWLNSNIFSSRREFLMTLFEEFGHIESSASDYTREFTEYFISKLVDISLEVK